MLLEHLAAGAIGPFARRSSETLECCWSHGELEDRKR